MKQPHTRSNMVRFAVRFSPSCNVERPVPGRETALLDFGRHLCNKGLPTGVAGRRQALAIVQSCLQML